MKTHLARIEKRLLQPNTGQIPGLPKNPRKIQRKDLSKLSIDLEKHPSVLEAIPLIVTPRGDSYVIIGGNMRYLALTSNEDVINIPCLVVEDVDASTLRKIALRDNQNYGQWDEALLLNWEALDEGTFDFLNIQAIDFSEFEESEDDPQKKQKQSQAVTCPKCGYLWNQK